MSADFASIAVNGRMTSDPKSFAVGDTKKTVFSIAVNRYFRKKDKQDIEKRTTFVDCVAWGRAADRVEKFGKKGAKVTATGDWETDQWEKDGNVVRKDHINIRNISIFTEPSADTSSQDVDDNEVPF